MLVNRLVTTKHTVQIHYTTKAKNNTALLKKHKENAENPEVGASSYITFNPTEEVEIPTKNAETGKTELKPSPPSQIGLGHELIHADRNARGVNLGDEEVTYFHKNVDGVIIQKRSTKNEMAVIGLRGHSSDDVTEIELRNEQGVDVRNAD